MASPSPARPLHTSHREFAHRKLIHTTDIAYSPRRTAAVQATPSQHYSLRHFNWEKREHMTPIVAQGEGKAASQLERTGSGTRFLSHNAFERSKAKHGTGVGPEGPSKGPSKAQVRDTPHSSFEEFSVLRARHLTGINNSPRRGSGAGAAAEVSVEGTPAGKSNAQLKAAKATHRVCIGGSTPRKPSASEAASPPPAATPQRGGYRSQHQFNARKGKHQIGREASGTPARSPPQDSVARSQREYQSKKGLHQVAPPPASNEKSQREAEGRQAGSREGELHVSHGQLKAKKTSHATPLNSRFQGTQSPFRVLRNSRDELKNKVKRCATDIQASTEATSTRRVTHYNGRSTDGDAHHSTAADLHIALTQGA
eukprot:Hpha_TRINITY_DN16420_c0_g1::TRINITY_DN16420_c0_g1_i1::g.163300::m.163300